MEVGLRESVDENDFFIGGEEPVVVAVLEARDFVFLAEVDFSFVHRDGGRFVEDAHEAVGFDLGAVGISDEAGNFEDFPFYKRGFVLAVGGEDGEVEVVTVEGHGGDF